MVFAKFTIAENGCPKESSVVYCKIKDEVVEQVKKEHEMGSDHFIGRMCFIKEHNNRPMIVGVLDDNSTIAFELDEIENYMYIDENFMCMEIQLAESILYERTDGLVGKRSDKYSSHKDTMMGLIEHTSKLYEELAEEYGLDDDDDFRLDDEGDNNGDT